MDQKEIHITSKAGKCPSGPVDAEFKTNIPGSNIEFDCIYHDHLSNLKSMYIVKLTPSIIIPENVTKRIGGTNHTSYLNFILHCYTKFLRESNMICLIECEKFMNFSTELWKFFHIYIKLSISRFFIRIISSSTASFGTFSLNSTSYNAAVNGIGTSYFVDN